eukprot:SAG11_NODE_9_length_28972_cov_81.532539_21_plen_85_part_00
MWRRVGGEGLLSYSSQVLYINVSRQFAGFTRFDKSRSQLFFLVSSAYGVVLERAGTGAGDEQGWKLVYSGDTRPCPALVAAVMS